jgi:hypothetical protein
METHEFLDYLDRYKTTRDLATEVDDVLTARRRRRERAGATVATPTQISPRVAS